MPRALLRLRGLIMTARGARGTLAGEGPGRRSGLLFPALGRARSRKRTGRGLPRAWPCSPRAGSCALAAEGGAWRGPGRPGSGSRSLTAPRQVSSRLRDHGQRSGSRGRFGKQAKPTNKATWPPG